MTSQLLSQLGQQLLGFAQHQMVDIASRRWIGGHVRAACHDRLAQRMRALHHLVKRSALDAHGRDHHHVGPGKRLVVERLDVHIDQPQLPVAGQQRRRGE